MTIGDGMKLKLRWCPAGRFTMGSPASEAGRVENEDDMAFAGGKPVSVTLSRGFWMAESEVTQSQWRQVLGTRPWRTSKFTLREGLDYPMVEISVGIRNVVPAKGAESTAAWEFCEKLQLSR